jgi:hypothetical protein
MRLAEVLIRLIAFAVLTFAPVRDAVACSCNGTGGPPCQNAFQVDAVFVGTVSSITALPDDEPPVRPGESRIPRAVRVDFTAVVAYRGVLASTLSVITAGSGPACGYSFKPGERYVVYATRPSDGSGLRTGICSRTRPLAQAGDDIRFLNTLAKPTPPGARVSGTITHWERDLATGDPLDHGPVPDVLVTVASTSSAFHATSNARGRYQLAVPPGKYQITASASAPLAVRDQQQEIDLRDPRACFVADFAVSFDAHISGAVRHASGEPASGVTIQLMAADDAGKSGNVQTLRARSDAGGGFEFTDVSPGRYVVGVGLTRSIWDGDVVFPRVFHPGTTDATSATVVRIDGGQQQSLEPMTLPAPRRTYRLTGTLVFEDGRPASRAIVSLWDGLERWRQVAAGIDSDDGTFSFVVHEGLSYSARAQYWDETQRASFSGTAGPFIVGPETPPLRIELSKRQ